MCTRTTLVTLVFGAALAAGCTNLDGSANRTGTGGLVGAASGAALGNLIGDGDEGATIVGGVLGATAGAAIGNRLDQQAAELEASIGGSGATIVNTGDRLVVSMPEAITFDTDSAAVRPGIQDELYSVARSLQTYPDTTVQVVGHTDSTGSAAYNQGLSERRARAVSDILIGAGTPAWRVQSYGRGFDQPVASNEIEAGRAANRRVEIVITPTA